MFCQIFSSLIQTILSVLEFRSSHTSHQISHFSSGSRTIPPVGIHTLPRRIILFLLVIITLHRSSCKPYFRGFVGLIYQIIRFLTNIISMNILYKIQYDCIKGKLCFYLTKRIGSHKRTYPLLKVCNFYKLLTFPLYFLLIIPLSNNLFHSFKNSVCLKWFYNEVSCSCLYSFYYH